MAKVYELYLADHSITIDAWEDFIKRLSRFCRTFSSWSLYVHIKYPALTFYVETIQDLPAISTLCPQFMLKPASKSPHILIKRHRKIHKFLSQTQNFITFYENQKVLKHSEIVLYKLTFTKLANLKILYSAHYVDATGTCQKIFHPSFSKFLAVNFKTIPNFTISSTPKFLDASKFTDLTATSPSQSHIATLDIFPYGPPVYLSPQNFDYQKHSIILGASGSGKSKFLSNLIKNTTDCKLVVIDPHAALQNDIGGLGRVVTFNDESESIDLFSFRSATFDPSSPTPAPDSALHAPDSITRRSFNNATIQVELLLDVFRDLIPSYNSKLEQVLRHALLVLIPAQLMTLPNFKSLLTNLETRNRLIRANATKIPFATQKFFQSEYHSIFTKSYAEAISPLLALISELEMVPAFTTSSPLPSLAETISQNRLTLFSLDRTQLGDHSVKILAGLLSCQVFNYIQNRNSEEHLVFIVDEVAVIENPILLRFLSESRKRHCSIILVGQYFGALSPALQTAIFANATNFYIFRVAQNDANSLVDSLSIKIPLDNTHDAKIKILTSLQNREFVMRVSRHGKLLPAVKCRTLDFSPVPYQPSHSPSAKTIIKPEFLSAPALHFSVSTTITLAVVTKMTSTRRQSYQERNQNE